MQESYVSARLEPDPSSLGGRRRLPSPHPLPQLFHEVLHEDKGASVRGAVTLLVGTAHQEALIVQGHVVEVGTGTCKVGRPQLEQLLVTTDHVLVETSTLLRIRLHRAAAEAFWDGLRTGVARLETIGPADLQAAWTIGRDFPDQDFSLVDRTSFAVMERLGLERAASFDDDFAIYRHGPKRSRAFEVVR